MNKNTQPIDPLFKKPHDNISGITDGDHQSVESVLERTDGKTLEQRRSFDKKRAKALAELTKTPDKKEHTVSKRGLALVIAGTALAGAWGLGSVVNEGEAPNPGNMVEFNNDPLQDEYNENSDGFTVEGGQIVRTPEDTNPPLSPIEVLPSPQVTNPSVQQQAVQGVQEP